MADSKKVKGEVVNPKTYWHLYSLQAIGSDKLVKIVNKILKREYQLFK